MYALFPVYPLQCGKCGGGFFCGGSEVMFWEPQNASLHHEGGGILLPTVAESECTNYKQCIE